MAGRNQHHIPQFFLRGFGIPRRSGKPKEIWVFRNDEAPAVDLIKNVAAGFDFYSPPSRDGTRTLDDDITDSETPLSDLVSRLRNLPVGAKVPAEEAARVLTELAPRTAHFRGFVTRGMRAILVEASQSFSNPDIVVRALGLDQSAPTSRFSEVWTGMKNEPQVQHAAQLLRLPDAVLEKVAFVMAKEHLAPNVAAIAQMLGGVGVDVASQADAIVREGHNRSVLAMLGESPRREGLREFLWSIESGPNEGAILPDCIAISLSAADPPLPYMASSHDDAVAIVMPLTTWTLLVGRRGETQVEIADVNQHAAACSHLEFYAAFDAAAFSSLRGTIGARTASTVDQAVSEALDVWEFRRTVLTLPGSTSGTDVPVSIGRAPMLAEQAEASALSYEVSFHACADEEKADQVASALNFLTSRFSHHAPLDRLDGVTFTSRFSESIRAFDRGSPDLPSIALPGQNGIASAPLVLRQGIVKARIVANAAVADGLLSSDGDHVKWALQVLTFHLASVAYVHFVDSALPGRLLTRIEDAYDSWMFGCIESALHGYVASRISGDFTVFEGTTSFKRQNAVEAIREAHDSIPRARILYRYHGDLDKLLQVALPAVTRILGAVADLLGHCAAFGETAVEEDSPLQIVLQETALKTWLAVYATDLDNFWLRRGAWKSFDEFLFFNLHVERMLWPFGIFPWRTPDNGLRFEIPIAIDASALLDAAGRGITIPGDGDDTPDGGL